MISTWEGDLLTSTFQEFSWANTIINPFNRLERSTGRFLGLPDIMESRVIMSPGETPIRKVYFVGERECLRLPKTSLSGESCCQFLCRRSQIRDIRGESGPPAFFERGLIMCYRRDPEEWSGLQNSGLRRAVNAWRAFWWNRGQCSWWKALEPRLSWSASEQCRLSVAHIKARFLPKSFFNICKSRRCALSLETAYLRALHIKFLRVWLQFHPLYDLPHWTPGYLWPLAFHLSAELAFCGCWLTFCLWNTKGSQQDLQMASEAEVNTTLPICIIHLYCAEACSTQLSRLRADVCRRGTEGV